MSENKQGSNLSYPVEVEKLEKLLQEKLGNNAAVSKIEDMLEAQNIIAGSTYKRILNERKAIMIRLMRLSLPAMRQRW